MKNYVNFRAFLFIAISLILGVSIGYFAFMRDYLGLFVAIFLSSMILVVALVLTGNKSCRYKIVIAIILAFITLSGAFYFTLRVNSYSSNAISSRAMSVKGRIVSVTDSGDFSTCILSDVEFVSVGDFTTNFKLKLTVYDGEIPLSLGVGDIITFNDEIHSPPLIYNEKFSFYNISNKINYTASISADSITKVGFYQTIFERVSFRIKAVFNDGLNESERGIATALILGDTGEIELDLLDNFRASGVAHVFAVSGLHIGFLTAILYFTLRRIGIYEWVKVLVTILIIFAYAGVCGFSPSSLRACITCTIMLLSRLFYFKYDALNSLSLSAIVLLLISPFYVFDVGFVLSYVTVLGILLSYNNFLKLFGFIKWKKLKNSLALVVSAFISSAPVSAYYFSNFSLIGILSNLIFVPLVSVLFTLLFVLTLLALIFGGSSIFLFIPSLIIRFLILVFNLIDFRIFSLEMSVVKGALLLYYISLILASNLINIRLKTRVFAVIMAIVLSLISFITVTLVNKNANKVYIRGDEYFSATIYSYKDNNVLLLSGKQNLRSLSVVKSVISVSGVSDIDACVISSNASQSFITKLYETAPFSSLFLTSDTKNNLSVLESYLGVEVISVTPFDKFTVCDLSVTYNGKGGLEIAKNDLRFLVFASAYNEFSYAGFDKDVDLIIASTSHQEIYSYYSPKALISFSENSIFKNAEKEGVVKYILRK